MIYDSRLPQETSGSPFTYRFRNTLPASCKLHYLLHRLALARGGGWHSACPSSDLRTVKGSKESMRKCLFGHAGRITSVYIETRAATRASQDSRFVTDKALSSISEGLVRHGKGRDAPPGHPLNGGVFHCAQAEMAFAM